MVENPQLVAAAVIIIGFHRRKDHPAAILQATNSQAKLAVLGQLDAPILKHKGLVEPPERPLKKVDWDDHPKKYQKLHKLYHKML